MRENHICGKKGESPKPSRPKAEPLTESPQKTKTTGERRVRAEGLVREVAGMMRLMESLELDEDALRTVRDTIYEEYHKEMLEVMGEQLRTMAATDDKVYRYAEIVSDMALHLEGSPDFRSVVPALVEKMQQLEEVWRNGDDAERDGLYLHVVLHALSDTRDPLAISEIERLRGSSDC